MSIDAAAGCHGSVQVPALDLRDTVHIPRESNLELTAGV